MIEIFLNKYLISILSYLAFKIHSPSPQGEMEVGIIDIKLLGSDKRISIANCYAPKTNKFFLKQFKLIVNASDPSENN